MGENCVQDQHFPTLPINLKNPTNNEGEGGDDSRSDPMNTPVAADFYGGGHNQRPMPHIKSQQKLYCKTTNILIQINQHFNSPSICFFALLLQTVGLSNQELVRNSMDENSREIEHNIHDHKRLACHCQDGSGC